METGSASASIPEDLGELSERVPLCVCKRGGKEGRREGGKKRRRGREKEGRREGGEDGRKGGGKTREDFKHL